MIKLTHHEMPVNKTLHHRTIEILTALTLLIGSPSFLIYFYCSHDTNNPLCQWLRNGTSSWLNSPNKKSKLKISRFFSIFFILI